MSPFLLVLSAHGLMVSSSYLRHAWLPTVAPVRENAAVTSDRTAAVRELFKRGGSPSAVQPALDPKSMFEQRRAQIEKINNDANALFNILDRNGDDVISREELGAHLLLARYTEEHVTKIFSVIDTNADGVISRNELRIAFERYPPIRVAPAMGLLPKRQRNALHAEADATFDQLDVNGDGLLSLEELNEHLAGKDGPEYSAVAVQKIFRTLDADADGRVTPSEFRGGYVRYRAMRLALGLRQPWELA